MKELIDEDELDSDKNMNIWMYVDCTKNRGSGSVKGSGRM